MRSRFLLFGILITATSAIHADDFKSARPNIILVVTDDQGYGEMGRHGHPILQTPHMDRFHDESVRFTDFCVSPTCAPSRAALMTGMQEFNSGVTHTLIPRRNMNRDVTILPQLLGKAGYATAHFGKWHLGHGEGFRPDQRGFDTSLTVPGDDQRSHYDPQLLRNGVPEKSEGYRTDIFFDEAMNWIGKRKNQPFFCFLATYSPHGPQVVPEAYSKPYLDRAASERVAKYYGQIANIDENLGRLMERLDKLGMADDTLVIFMSDNGGTFGIDTYNAGMRGAKTSVWSGGTRTFCFWRWPRRLQARDEPMLAGHVDLLPTLLDLVGGELPETVGSRLEGISLLPRLNDPHAAMPDRMLFQHVGRWTDGLADAHRQTNAAVRWKSWHLVNQGVVEGCVDDCRNFRRVAKGNQKVLYTGHADIHYRVSDGPGWELFDLAADPHQDHDISCEHPDIVGKMSNAYDSWWRKVRPRMIHDPVK